MKRNRQKSTGYCLNCGKKLDSIQGGKLFCGLSCNEQYYYREVVKPKKIISNEENRKKREIIKDINKLLKAKDYDSLVKIYIKIQEHS